ncbi:MAG: hypothetical protein H6709_21220 [Kofleriaceae bacterium]|nr:hypothetical protein [Myxococcales bacterium]MCB9561673.1 hypothetical protein [Kofleriaceae bacterium]MCB9574605.1 hypothetical protein [Kofleriaceae bacterium]
MRVRKAFVAGVGVDPSTLSPPNLTFGRNPTGLEELPYEVEFTLADLRTEFFVRYGAWIADLREDPDEDDELEAQLRQLAWPSLGVLLEVEPELCAVVLLCMGRELLLDLEHGRDPAVAVRWVPASVDEVELRGRRIVLRGTALELRRRPVALRPAAMN